MKYHPLVGALYQPATQAFDSQADTHVTQLSPSLRSPLHSPPQSINYAQPAFSADPASTMPQHQPDASLEQPTAMPTIHKQLNSSLDVVVVPRADVEDSPLLRRKNVHKLSTPIEGERPSKRHSPCATAPSLYASMGPEPPSARRPASAPYVKTPIHIELAATQPVPPTMPLSPPLCTPPTTGQAPQGTPEVQGTLRSVSSLLDTLICSPADADDDPTGAQGAASSLAAWLSSGGPTSPQSQQPPKPLLLFPHSSPQRQPQTTASSMLALPIPATGTAEAWVQQGAALEEQRLKRSRQDPVMCMQHCEPNHAALAGAHALQPQDVARVNLPEMVTADEYEALLAVEEDVFLKHLEAQRVEAQRAEAQCAEAQRVEAQCAEAQCAEAQCAEAQRAAMSEVHMACFPCDEAAMTEAERCSPAPPSGAMLGELTPVITPTKQTYAFATPPQLVHAFTTPPKQVHAFTTPFNQVHAFTTPSNQVHAFTTPSNQVHACTEKYAYFPSRAHALVQEWVRGKFGSWDALAQHWGVTIVPGC